MEQVRWSTVVMVLLVLAGMVGAGGFAWRVHARSAEWRKLIGYACWKQCLPLDQWEEFYAIARRALPDEPADAEVLRTIATGVPGSTRRILILVSDPARPGQMRVHLFNESRDHLGVTPLPCGPLAGLVGWEGQVMLDNLLDGSFVLTVAQTQYHSYGLYKDTPVLLEMRDIYGKFPSNDYVNPGCRVGPPLPADALTRCESMLSSSDPVEILQALTWLHGRHAEGSGWAELRQRPAVERRLRELAAKNETGVSVVAAAMLPAENAASRADR